MSALWLDINSWYYKLLYILFSKLGVSISLIWPNYPLFPRPCNDETPKSVSHHIEFAVIVVLVWRLISLVLII
jgi:hypothetical protein